jgi:hypothetical protein
MPPQNPAGAASHPPNTRQIVRDEIERILSQTVLPLPAHRLTARRVAARKSLAMRIEKSLYKRAPNMNWYADRTALAWRVVRIAQEMLLSQALR